MKRKILGKGLSAILPSIVEESIKQIPVEKLIQSKFQPRTKISISSIRELANSIKEKGVLEPVIVRPRDEKYEIVAGQRRFLAVKEAGFKEIPCIVKELNDQDALEIALIENLHRENLNPIEEARTYQILNKEFGLTHEEIAKRVGKDRSTITNTLRLLSLPSYIQNSLEKEEISEGHARVLLSLETKEQRKFFEDVIKKNLSVRELERQVKEKVKKEKKKIEKKREFVILEQELKEKTGYNFEILAKGKKVLLKIYFNSRKEMEEFIENLLRGNLFSFKKEW